jgi:tetratricopeptide (TPR) repeat protein
MWNRHFVFPYYDPGYFDYRSLTDNLNRLYLVAGLVGLFAAIRRWGKYALPLWLTLFYLVGVNALVRIEFRYTLPGYPLLLAFAALGLWEVVQAVRGGEKTYRLKLLGGAGVALLLVIILSAALPLIPPTNATREKALDTMAQADDFNEIRQFWKAEPLYNEAIIMYPSEGQLWSGRGNYFAGTNDLNKAIADYSKAIELDPRAPDPYRWRGQAYLKEGHSTEARTDYQKFLALAPANHPARSKVERELLVIG